MICDTCANKNYCEPHRRIGEIIVICGAYKKPPTNADRIRAMSDEDLADWVSGITRCDYCPAKPCKSLYHCETQWLTWLQSPADGS